METLNAPKPAKEHGRKHTFLELPVIRHNQMARNPLQPWSKISSECQSFRKHNSFWILEGGCGNLTCVKPDYFWTLTCGHGHISTCICLPSWPASSTHCAYPNTFDLINYCPTGEGAIPISWNDIRIASNLITGGACR